MSVLTTPVFQLTFKINSAMGGVSEKLYLGSANIADALTLAAKFLLWRLACLPQALKVEWASVTQRGAPADGRAVGLTFPLDGAWPGSTFTSPTDDDKSPNLRSDALRYRLETAEGPSSTRWLHGVPDTQISQDELVAAVTAASGDPGLIVATNLSWVAAAGKYLGLVATQSKFYREKKNGSNPVIKESFDIAALIIRGVRNKTMGRPFGLSVARSNPR